MNQARKLLPPIDRSSRIITQVTLSLSLFYFPLLPSRGSRSEFSLVSRGYERIAPPPLGIVHLCIVPRSSFVLQRPRVSRGGFYLLRDPPLFFKSTERRASAAQRRRSLPASRAMRKGVKFRGESRHVVITAIPRILRHGYRSRARAPVICRLSFLFYFPLAEPLVISKRGETARRRQTG